jgi:hypothetical protein
MSSLAKAPTATRTLEYVSQIVRVVLQAYGEVGMPGPRASESARTLLIRELARLGIHDVLPVFVVAIANQQSDGRAERFAVTHAGEDFGFIGFNLHAAAAAVALLPAPHLVIDEGRIDSESGRQALNYGDETFAVRFASGSEVELAHPIPISRFLRTLILSRNSAARSNS